MTLIRFNQVRYRQIILINGLLILIKMPHLTGACHLIKNVLTRSCWSEGRSEQSDTANAPCFPVPSQEAQTGGKNEGRCGEEVTKRLSKEITDPLEINSISGLVSCILLTH